jgi:hypothetical protein
MNLNGIKFTINFSNSDNKKKEFYQFIKTLNIEEGLDNKKNLKFIKYKLKDDQYFNNYENIMIDTSFLLDINVYKLGPDILSIKETNKDYLTLNFQNICHQIKLQNNDILKKVLSNETFDKLLNRIFLDSKNLAGKRFDILVKIYLYLKEKNLHTKTTIKSIDFVHYNFSNDFIKLFDNSKKIFLDSNITYNIKSYYFDNSLIYTNKENYIKEYNILKDKFDSEQIKVKKYDSNDRVRFISCDKNIVEKKFEINGKQFLFKPLIDKESSYIAVNHIQKSNLIFKCNGNNYLKLEQEPFQIIKVKVSGWFTKNKKILELKNEVNRYNYKLSDDFEEILEHINSFLKRHTIYEIKNKENMKLTIYENMEDEEIENNMEDEEDEDYDPFENPNYDVYEDEDLFSNHSSNDEKETPDLIEQFLENLEKQNEKDIKGKEEINVYDFIHNKDKISKPLIKRFEKKEDVKVLEYSKAFENLNKLFSKYK